MADIQSQDERELQDGQGSADVSAGASVQNGTTAETSAQTHQEAAQPGDAAQSGEFDENSATLNEMYDHLRHSVDSAELDAFASRPLPDPKDAAAFSRATALLEAVAGNLHTSVATRVALARDMKFPNILVKLSEDPDPTVRAAVAANEEDKNWLVGRLTKDPEVFVREAALKNKQTSWKMRMEGAEDPQIGAQTLDFLARMGTEEGFSGPAVLAAMVRRAVALNPSASEETVQRLAQDGVPDVSHAAQQRLAQ